ncbi:SGNH/GDSL hydrolase family protein [Candidatus Sumerlaeota bacterium]|nr:SGNH/GDSL hydrolase family protein [Candidatus Sumerlaeota bacterium]
MDRILKTGVFFVCLVNLTGCSFMGGSEPQMRNETDKWFHPLWEGKTAYGDTLFFIRYSQDELPKASLLFPLKRMIRVEQPGSGIIYEQGKDFVIGSDKRTLFLPEGSRIPFKNHEEFFPMPNAPNSYPAAVDGVHHVMWAEGHFFHDLEVEATYEHSGNDWAKSLKPSRGESISLPLSQKKLKQEGEFKICLLGDSISCGANASAMTNAQPFMPFYGELLASWLRKNYPPEIIFKNFSVGGQSSSWGIGEMEKIVPEKPDLVIIAFGMNDASFRIPPEEYANNIKKQMEKISRSNPECEFILVATMTANPKWNCYSLEHYMGYRDILLTMRNQGVAVADVTSLWIKVLERKTFYDLTGNGVNHPNDFGHRLYAHVLIDLFE